MYIGINIYIHIHDSDVYFIFVYMYFCYGVTGWHSYFRYPLRYRLNVMEADSKLHLNAIQHIEGPVICHDSQNDQNNNGEDQSWLQVAPDFESVAVEADMLSVTGLVQLSSDGLVPEHSEFSAGLKAIELGLQSFQPILTEWGQCDCSSSTVLI